MLTMFNTANDGRHWRNMVSTLPETGFLRLSQIIGNEKSTPPIPAIIPVKKSCWWSGVKSGRFPKPVKLGPRVTCVFHTNIVSA